MSTGNPIKIAPSWGAGEGSHLDLIDALHSRLRSFSGQAETLRDSLYADDASETHIGAADAIYHGVEDLREWLTEWEERQAGATESDEKPPTSIDTGDEAESTASKP